MRKDDAVKQAAATLGEFIAAQGWVDQQGLLTFAQEHDWELEQLHKAIRLLDRQRLITARTGPAGAAGWESLVGSTRSRSTYGAMSRPVQITMIVRSPVLGEVSLDGLKFSLLRDGDGTILFKPAQFRAMLVKAYRQCGFSADPGFTESSVGRIAIAYLGCEIPERGTIEALRRPINIHHQAVGECRHEALPPKTRIRWRLAYPDPPWSTESISRLLDAAQHVGFSPAGNGRNGGAAGLFHWEEA